MPNEFGRNLRVAEQIKRELAPLVQRMASDLRAGIVTLTAVEVAPDLCQAKVYISCLGPNAADIVAAVNRSSGHLRHHLSRCLRLRKVPRLTVLHDLSLERGARLSALIRSLVDTEDARIASGSPPSEVGTE